MKPFNLACLLTMLIAPAISFAEEISICGLASDPADLTQVVRRSCARKMKKLWNRRESCDFSVFPLGGSPNVGRQKLKNEEWGGGLGEIFN